MAYCGDVVSLMLNCQRLRQSGSLSDAEGALMRSKSLCPALSPTYPHPSASPETLPISLAPCLLQQNVCVHIKLIKLIHKSTNIYVYMYICADVCLIDGDPSDPFLPTLRSPIRDSGTLGHGVSGPPTALDEG